MFYGKGEEKTGLFQNPAEAKRDYKLRDLAQGKTERHNFKGNLDSNFKKCMGCEPSILLGLGPGIRELCPSTCEAHDGVHPGPQLTHST